MKIVEKQFNENDLNLFSNIKTKFNKKINNPKIVNNSYLIFKKLLENKKGNYVECGVFMGGTLMSAVEFTKQNNIDFNFFGVDTFEGFPSVMEHNKNDLPNKFTDLYNDKLISKEHFLKAKKRTNNFSDISHLEPPYFNSDFSFLFNFCEKNNVSLLKGKFLLNLDSEEWGTITISSAGGGDSRFSKKYKIMRKSSCKKNKLDLYTLEIKNIEGGHSGEDIHLPR